MTRKATSIVLLAIVMMVAPSCETNQRPNWPFGYSFESDEDLDRITWRCRLWYGLSDSFVVHGRKSLKLVCYPDVYSSLSIHRFYKDWRGHHALVFHVHNPQSDTLTLHVRIDDRRRRPPYEDRFNTQLPLPPGPNEFRIPFSQLMTSGTRRRLNLGNIESVFIFLAGVTRPTTLFFDYIHLE